MTLCSVSLAFSPPSSFRVDTLVYLFFGFFWFRLSYKLTCFLRHSIFLFLCEVPILMIEFGCPFILKSDMQTRMLVLFLCVCAVRFLSSDFNSNCLLTKGAIGSPDMSLLWISKLIWDYFFFFWITFPIHFSKSLIPVATNLIFCGIICSVTLPSYLPFCSCTNSA